uniref:Uncharacterized protein n=1 Tax=Oryza punctata TaxID=4537 RepID=A0A0E0LTA4_ORYPU
MSSSGDTPPPSPDLPYDGGGALSDHNNSAVVVPPEETPMEVVTIARPPDASMEHGGHHDAAPVAQRGGGAPAGSSSTAASPQPPRLDGPTLERELRRCYIKLGKQKVFGEASTAAMAATVPEEPPRKKLMHDGIRAIAAAAAPPRSPPTRIISYVVTTAAPPERNKTAAAANRVPLPPPPAADNRFHNLRACSAQLRRRLEELDATAPEFVCEKTLQKSDVHRNQNRLLFSCKRVVLDQCPITHLFTDKETQIVHKKDEIVVEKKKKKIKREEEKKEIKREEEKLGLKVTVFDQGGNEYGMTCRYLDSNGGYRFIEGWGKFVRTNGMAISDGQRWTRDVVVKLLAFRSRRLARGADQSDHPDGAIGFVVLHHENRRRRGNGDIDSDNDDDNEEENKAKAPPANPKKKKKSNGKEEPIVRASPAAAAAAAAVGVVAPKREVSVAPRRVARSSLEWEARAVLGLVKLWSDTGSSSSSQEYNGSKSSEKEEKTDG